LNGPVFREEVTPEDGLRTPRREISKRAERPHALAHHLLTPVPTASDRDGTLAVHPTVTATYRVFIDGEKPEEAELRRGSRIARLWWVRNVNMRLMLTPDVEAGDGEFHESAGG